MYPYVSAVPGLVLSDEGVQLNGRGVQRYRRIQSKRSRKGIAQDEKNESVAVNVVSKKGDFEQNPQKEAENKGFMPVFGLFLVRSACAITWR